MDSTDKTKKTSSDRRSFDDIITSGIDDLNVTHSFQETSMRHEEVVTKTKSSVFSTWWFKALVVIYVVTTAAYVILDQRSPEAMTIEEADRQLEHFFRALEVPEKNWK